MKLAKAAKQGKIQEVKAALSSGESVDARDDENFTALLYAALYGNFDVCEFLIKHGANVNARDKSDWTPLMCAALKGKRKVLKLLIDSGADIDARSDYGRTALTEAAYSGNDSCVVELLAAGADINAVGHTPPGTSPLFDALRQGHQSTVRLLITEGANLRQIEESGISLLVQSIQNNWTDVAELAIASGADVQYSPEYGDTALIAALRTNNLKITRMLLERGAQIDLTKQEERLLEALGYASPEQFDLISAKLSLNTELENKISRAALLARNIPLVSALRRKGYRLPPGSLVIGTTDLELTKFLLSEGADPNDADPFGQKPLNFATSINRQEIAELLLDAGADVNGFDINGMAPLHVAARNGLESIAKVLIERGAEVNLESGKNSAKISPIMFAAGSANETLFELLLDRGADLRHRDANRLTILTWAACCQKPNMNIVNKILELGVDPNEGPVNSRPLLRACSAGYYEDRYVKPKKFADDNLGPYIKRLLEAGAEADLKSTEWGINNMTALELAKHTRCPEVVELLKKHGAK